MPRTPTGRPPGRPKTKDYDTLLARVPHDLVTQVKRYAAVHRQSISELIRDGLQWRIEQDTPGRRLSTVFQPDNGHTPPMPENGETVGQELSPMARAAIAAAVRETLHTVFPVPQGEHGEDVLQHDTGESQHAAATLEAERTVSAPRDVVPHDISESPRYYLGKPCPKPGHTDAGTGKAERRKNNGRCRECDKEAKRAARRTAAGGRG